MNFKELSLKGAYLISIDRSEDERGFFARSFCVKEFEGYNLCTRFVQNNLSYNKKKGTLRGMHYQQAPFEEDKLISCIKGSIYDVVIDLRMESETRNHWVAVELNSKSYNLLYVPHGFAHGFQTLEDDTVVIYQMSEFYHSEAARGIRWDDSFFKIEWPLQEKIISFKDRGYYLFTDRC